MVKEIDSLESYRKKIENVFKGKYEIVGSDSVNKIIHNYSKLCKDYSNLLNKIKKVKELKENLEASIERKDASEPNVRYIANTLNKILKE